MRRLILALFALAVAAASARAQDAHRGLSVFATNCSTCHSTAAGKTVLGPSLHAVVGRKAGTLTGFDYSTAMKASGVTWTPQTLDAYLTGPQAFIPRVRMSFPGLKAQQDRADVIAYLATQR